MTADMSGPICDRWGCDSYARWSIISLFETRSYACGVHLNHYANDHYEKNSEGSDAILVQKVWNP